MIRAVMFDLDGTLYNRDAAIRTMAEEQFEAVKESLPAMEKTEFTERLIAMDDHGYNRPRGMHHLLAKSLGCDSQVGDRLEECFRNLYPKRCKLDADAVQTLETLRSDGMKLALVTNGPVEWQSRKIECMNIAPFFDAILISEAEGVQKPDARIFGRALERCGVAASESIFVGDHPENDIAGSAAAGLTPVWKRVPYWDVPPDVYRIDRLSELLPIYRKQV